MPACNARLHECGAQAKDGSFDSTRGADECQYSHRRAAGDEARRNPTLYLAAFAIVTVLEVVPGAYPMSETYTQSSGGAILAKW